MCCRSAGKFSDARREKKEDGTVKSKEDIKLGKTCPINIFYTNANGLTNKIDELKLILSTSNDIDIICITETHLNSDILDAEIYIDGFSLYRNDRNFDIDPSDINPSDTDPSDATSGGGGSIIYFKNHMNVYDMIL